MLPPSNRGWVGRKTVFTNHLIPTPIVRAVQRKPALVTFNVFPFWMSSALVAQYWRDLHRMSPHLGPPTPLEFVGHPRLGCAGDNPCLERCRERSYRPRPLAGVLSILVALPTADNADTTSVFNIARLMLPWCALCSSIVSILPPNRHLCVR